MKLEVQTLGFKTDSWLGIPRNLEGCLSSVFEFWKKICNRGCEVLLGSPAIVCRLWSSCSVFSRSGHKAQELCDQVPHTGFFSPACQHYGLSFCVRYGGFTFPRVCSLHQSGSSALERAAALWQQCMGELGCSMASRLVWKCLDALSFERGKLRPADVSVQYGNSSVKGEVWNWVNENEMWSWECGVNEVFLSFHFYGCILFLGK